MSAEDRTFVVEGPIAGQVRYVVARTKDGALARAARKDGGWYSVRLAGETRDRAVKARLTTSLPLPAARAPHRPLGDRHRTQLQETGRLPLGGGVRLWEVVDLLGDLGLELGVDAVARADGDRIVIETKQREGGRR